MDEEPNSAEPQKPRRRWFQFRLRTLLIGVVLLGTACGYVAHEAKIVRERAAILDWMNKRAMLAPQTSNGESIILRGDWLAEFDDSKRTWIRRLLNDHFVLWVSYSPGVSPDEVNRVKAGFPEASVLPCDYRDERRR